MFRFLKHLLPPMAGLLLLAGCSEGGWHNVDVSGSVPDLAFSMTRASDGQVVDAEDYRGKVALLYSGYSFCPDVCPLTLSNVGQVLKAIGPAARGVRVLFVTVDPARDTLPVLKTYMAAFGPQFVGLRGDENALASLARRFRIAYSVTPDTDPDRYVVTHSSALYVFDRQGKARLLVSSLSGPDPDIAGAAEDLRRILAGD